MSKKVTLPGTVACIPEAAINSALWGTCKNLPSLLNANKVLRAKGLSGFGFFHIGGLDVLLTFPNLLRAKDFLEKGKPTWSVSFENLQIWDGENEPPFSRIACLSISGLPLLARDDIGFQTIGELFGRKICPLDFSWNSHDMAAGSMFILTNSRRKIDEEVEVTWKNKTFMAWVCEENFNLWPQIDDDGSSDMEGDDFDPSAESESDYDQENEIQSEKVGAVSSEKHCPLNNRVFDGGDKVVSQTDSSVEKVDDNLNMSTSHLSHMVDLSLALVTSNNNIPKEDQVLKRLVEDRVESCDDKIQNPLVMEVGPVELESHHSSKSSLQSSIPIVLGPVPSLNGPRVFYGNSNGPNDLNGLESNSLLSKPESAPPIIMEVCSEGVDGEKVVAVRDFLLNVELNDEGNDFVEVKRRGKNGNIKVKSSTIFNGSMPIGGFKSTVWNFRYKNLPSSSKKKKRSSSPKEKDS